MMPVDGRAVMLAKAVATVAWVRRRVWVCGFGLCLGFGGEAGDGSDGGVVDDVCGWSVMLAKAVAAVATVRRLVGGICGYCACSCVVVGCGGYVRDGGDVSDLPWCW